MSTRNQARNKQTLNDGLYEGGLDRPSTFRRTVAWMTLIAYVGQPLLVTAQTTADQAAAANKRPVVDVTANGIPLVQIATPNAAGLSHNQYNQFNVDPAGLILNNSQTAVQTQQAGYVVANPNLANGAAHVILNEVTGTGRSQLNGYIEVAGQQAEVIVANPNGITCNGCGFINANRGVLTTGTPVIGMSGSLDAFRVTGGDIQIGSAGLNGNNLSQLDLIARSVQVNGQLWGTNLNVITGANLVDYNTLGVQVIQGEGTKPTVGIDVALLGGMYANKIRLIGTEAGVGVNSLGTLSAQAGDFYLDYQGQITLMGSTSASGNLTIHSNTGISNTGSLYSQQTTQLTSAGSINNAGNITAIGTLGVNSDTDIINSGELFGQQAIQLTGSRSISNSGKLYSQQDAQLTSSGGIANSGTLSAQGNLTLGAASVNSTGALGAGINASGVATQHGNLLISTAQGQTIASGTNIAGGSFTIIATDINLANSNTNAADGISLTATAGNINLNNAVTQSVSDIILTATGGSVSNDQGSMHGALIKSTSAGFSNVNGGIYASKDLTIDSTAAFYNNGGVLSATQQATLTSLNVLDNSVSATGKGGYIGAGTTLTITANNVALNNTAGTIESGTDTTLRVQSINNTGGSIKSLGSLSVLDIIATQGILNNASNGVAGFIGSKGQLKLKTVTLDNTGSKIFAQDLLSIQSNQLNNQNGLLQTNGSLDFVIAAALNNRAGKIEANGTASTMTLQAGSIDNTLGGRIANSGTGLTTIDGGTQIDNTGILGGRGDLTIKAAVLNNNTVNAQQGQVISGGNLVLGITGALNNTGGKIYAAGNLDFVKGATALTAATFDNTLGEISSTGTSTFDLASVNNAGGKIAAGQNIFLTSAALNGIGSVMADGSETISLQGDYTNEIGNVFFANNGLTFTTTGNLTNNTAFESLGNLAVSAANITNTAGGSFTASQTAPDKNGAFTRGRTTLTATGGVIVNNGQINGDDIVTSSNTFTNNARIIGDTVSITAYDLTNQSDTAIIGATSNIDLWITHELKNLNGAEIFSMDDLNIAKDGTQDASGNFTNLTTWVLNEGSSFTKSSVIEAWGNINIGAARLDNQRPTIAVSDTKLTPEITTLSASPSNTLTYGGFFESDIVGGVDTGTHSFTALGSKVYYELISTPTSAYQFALNNRDELGLPHPSTQIIKAADIASVTVSTPDIFTPSVYTVTLNNGTVYTFDTQVRLGQYYDVNYYAGYDPNVNIRPTDRITQQGDHALLFENTRTLTVTTTDQTINPVQPKQAKILASGNININLGQTGALTNYVSTIEAGHNLTINGQTTEGNPLLPVHDASHVVLPSSVTINNQALTLQETVATDLVSQLSGNYNTDCANIIGTCYNSSTETRTYHPKITEVTSPLSTLPSTITAGGKLSVHAEVLANQASNQGTNITGSTLGGSQAPASVTGTGTPATPPQSNNTAITVPSSGLYTIHPQPGQQYLVVTDPRFTNYKNFVSSDYMMSHMTLDAQATQKRLGDGFYEQRLVNDQITQLTGRRFVAPYANTDDEYRALMDAAIDSMAELKLTPGIALTKTQIAALTKDIVWMVDEKVTLPDGTTTQALVPKVYLTAVHATDLKPNGALIAADVVDIKLATAQKTNSEVEQAHAVANSTDPHLAMLNTAVQTDAQSVWFSGAGGLAQSMQEDTKSGVLTNTGTIHANSALTVNALDINNHGGTLVSGGSLKLDAANDISNQSGSISGKTVNLTAGHDIINTTATRTITVGNSSIGASNTLIGSTGSISATDNLSMVATNDISIMGALVQAGGDATLHAGNNLTIGTVVAEATSHSAYTGFNYDTKQTTNISSSIKTGGNLTLGATNDVHVTSANMDVGKDATLTAGGNLTLDTAKDTSSYDQSANGKKISYSEKRYDETVVGGSLKVGGNVTLHATQLKTDSDGKVSSENTADSIIAAAARTDGKGKITVEGFSVNSKQGNVTVYADANVDIKAATEEHTSSVDLRTSKSGGLKTTTRTTNDETWRTDVVGSSLTGNNISITSGKDINVIGSTVEAQKDINVAAMGDVNVIAATSTYGSSHYANERTTGLQAQNAFSITDKGPETTSKARTDGTNQSEHRSSLSSKGGNLTVTAGGNIIGVGADLAAAGDVALTAVGGSVVLYAGKDTLEQSSSTQTVTNPNAFTKQRLTITDTSGSVTYQGGTLQGNSVKINSAGDTILQATKVTAGTGGIDIDAGGDLLLLAAANQSSHSHTETLATDGYTFRADGSLNDTDTRRKNNKAEGQTVTNQVTSLVSGGNIKTHSDGDTLFDATTLDAQGTIHYSATGYETTYNADGTVKQEGRKGTVTFAGVKDTTYTNVVDSQNSMPWQSSSGHGEMVETLQLANIHAGGGITYDAKGGVIVDIPEVPATPAPKPQLDAHGKPIPVVPLTPAQQTAQQQAALDNHIQTLASKPGQEWIGQLAQMAKEKPDAVKLQQVNTAAQHWDYAHDGLTQEAVAVIVIVVTYFTAGTGSSAVGTTAAGGTSTTLGGATLATTSTVAGVTTTTYTALGAAINAGFSALASQATVALINNHGDIGHTLNDLGKSENVKATIAAMLTAGITQGLGSADYMHGIQASANAPLSTSSLLAKLELNLTNATVNTAVNSAVYGTSFTNALGTNLQNAGIDTIAAVTANVIGQSYKDPKGYLNGEPVLHDLAHAALGCATAAAKKQDCGSGALGGVVGEVSAELIGGTGDVSQLTPAQHGQIVFLTQLVTAGAAISTGSNLNTALATSQNAVVNNYLTAPQDDQKQKELRNCKTIADCNAVRDKWNKVSQHQTQEALVTLSNGQGDSTMLTVDDIKQVREELRTACAAFCTAEKQTSLDELNGYFNQNGEVNQDALRTGNMDWVKFTKAGIGLAGSLAGTATGALLTAAGGALVLAPEPTGVSKPAGALTATTGVTMLVDATPGIYSNSINLFRATQGSLVYLPDGGFGLIADAVAPGNQTAQDFAQIASLGMAFAGGRVYVGTVPAYGDSAFSQYVPATINGMLDANEVTSPGVVSGLFIANTRPGTSTATWLLDKTQILQLGQTAADYSPRLLPSSTQGQGK